MTGRKIIKAVSPASSFSSKMMSLRMSMSQDSAATDCRVARFRDALTEARLDFKATALECGPAGEGGLLGRFLFLIIDRTSGEEEEYLVYGAADSLGREGLHTVYDSALREFIAINFFPSPQ